MDSSQRSNMERLAAVASPKEFKIGRGADFTVRLPSYLVWLPPAEGEVAKNEPTGRLRPGPAPTAASEALETRPAIPRMGVEQPNMIPASVRSVPINSEPIGALRYLSSCNRGVTETGSHRHKLLKNVKYLGHCPDDFSGAGGSCKLFLRRAQARARRSF